MQVSQKSTGIGFAIADGSGIVPIVFLFWYMLGSPRLLIPPAVAVASSLITSYAAGNVLISAGLSVPMYEPNIMLFLCLALSIDYSFFLLTRLQEERQTNNADISAALGTSLTHSGSTVLLSGGVLVVTWAALGLFPVYGLDAVGYCSALTVFLCIVSNLVIIPSLLLSFPEFFARSSYSISESCCCCCCCGHDRSEHTDVHSLLPDKHERNLRENSSPGSPSLSVTALPKNGRGKNCYETLGRMVTRAPAKFLVPLVVFTVFFTGCTQLFGAKLSLALNINLGD